MIQNQIPRPEHPNPIQMRESWENLNGEWLFYNDFGIGPSAAELIKPHNAAVYDQRILVPFCPESKLSQIENKDFMRSVWYKRSVRIPKEKLSGRVMLHFGAVDYEAEVFVNGGCVGRHWGGYTSFAFDITDYVTEGENDITLHARDEMENIPYGKQTALSYHPYGCLYTRTTGIWQTVWLEYLPSQYIKNFRVYPDVNRCAFDLELVLSQGGQVCVEAFYEGKPVGSVTQKVPGTYGRLHLPLQEKHLWEPGHGRLYDLRLTLASGGQRDVLSSYAGLREVQIDGFRVRINGRSVFQRLVLDQGYYPEGIYTAPEDGDLQRDIALSMRLGFNGARLHEKVFEPRFLYYCDRAGYLVWGEHGNWGLDMDEERTLLRVLPEWCEAVARDFNHPAIIGWCPLNEAKNATGKTAQRLIETIYNHTKQLDPTRPVIDVSGFCHVVTDIYDQHDYLQDPETFRNRYIGYDGSRNSFWFDSVHGHKFIPNLPLFISEFGGLKWISQAHRDLVPEGAWGCGEPESEEAFFTLYEQLTGALLEAPNVMGFCYTQLYDVEQEVNGLYTYGRKDKFASYARITAANGRKAAIEE